MIHHQNRVSTYLNIVQVYFNSLLKPKRSQDLKNK